MAEFILDGIRCRTIQGYSRYAVGEDGSVWAVSGRSVERNAGNPFRKKIVFTTHGYPAVGLLPDACTRRPKLVVIHRQVLKAFYGAPPKGCEACHNNGIKTDNRLENLRWDTHQSNTEDKLRHGAQPFGSQVVVSKLTENDVDEIKKRLVNGDKQQSIANDFGVSREAVSRIRTGNNWKNVSPELHAKFPSNNKAHYRKVSLA